METFIWHERDICCSSAVCESPAASCCQCVCVCVHFHVSLLWYSWCQCHVSSVDNIGASWKAHFLSSFLHWRVTVRPKPTSGNVAILKCQFVRCAAIQWSSSTLPNALLMNYDGTPFSHLLWCHAKENQQTQSHILTSDPPVIYYPLWMLADYFQWLHPPGKHMPLNMTGGAVNKGS